MSLIANERWKLLASALSTLGIAFIVTGIVAPLASVAYRGIEQSGWTISWLLISPAWFFAGVGLHALGQMALGKLK